MLLKKKPNNYSGKWMINDEIDMNAKPDQVPAVYYIP
jgi:hypothetical protein